MSGPTAPQWQVPQSCYRHPGRQTYLRCNRCERYVCPECMRAAPVGHQCVECVQQAGAQVVRPYTQAGGLPRSATPVITYALIAVNVLVFLLTATSPGLERQLAIFSPLVAAGQWYRLVTSAFVHYGVTHLLFNMWALYVVGKPLEAWLGRLRFAALYALSGLGGSVLVYLLAPLNSVTAGASGAVFGLFGALFVMARRLNLDVRGIVTVIVINLAFTFVVPAISTQQISWQGHVGGLITGVLIGAVYAAKQRWTLLQAAVTVGVPVLFVAAILWRTAQLAAVLSP